MTVVLGTFPNAETAAEACATLLGEGASRPELTALVRAVSHALPETPGIRWVRAADGDGVQDAAETAIAGALVGLLLVGALANIPVAWEVIAARLAGTVAAGGVVSIPGAVMMAALAIGALAGAWVGRGYGLPRD